MKPAPHWPPEAVHDWHERVGIAHYGGGLSVVDAEALAWEQVRRDYGVAVEPVPERRSTAGVQVGLFR